MTRPTLEQILAILKDRQWHDINEIAEKTRLTNLKIQIIVDFLAKYNFIELDREKEKLKISSSLADFFHNTSFHEAKKIC